VSVSPGERTTVLVAATGDAWEAEVLERLGREGLLVGRRCVDLADLLAASSTGLASVAVVSSRLPGLDADSVETLGRSGVAVVVVGTAGDLDPAERDRITRLGATAVVADDALAGLADVVRGAGVVVPAPETVPEVPRTGQGRMLVVWGAAGAPGRTTVATGLAAALAAAGHETFLLDADPYGGTVAQHLGVLDEVSGLLAAARAANSGLLGPDVLARHARAVGERLRVLTGLPRPDRWPEVRAGAFDTVLDDARRLAAYVVVDVGFSLEQDALGAAPRRNLMTTAALERADEVVVVGAADPVGLARLARGLVELRELLPGARPRVVVNRTRPSLGWSDREVRGMVEGFVTPRDVHFLPDDRAAADRALMSGTSLAESGESSLRTAVASLAAAVSGGAPPGKVRRRRAGRAP